MWKMLGENEKANVRISVQCRRKSPAGAVRGFVPFGIIRFARVTKLCDAWGLTRTGTEVPVTIAAVATMSNNRTLFIMRKICDNFSVAFYDCADWNFHDKIFAGFARRFLTRTSLAVFGN